MADTRMTEQEREAFLADLHVGVISIPRPDGPPLTVPIWYDYEPGGDIWADAEPGWWREAHVDEGRIVGRRPPLADEQGEQALTLDRSRSFQLEQLEQGGQDIDLLDEAGLAAGAMLPRQTDQ